MISLLKFLLQVSKNTYSPCIVSEDLLHAGSQILASALTGRDVFFFEQDQPPIEVVEVQSVEQAQRILSESTSVFHFQTSGTTGVPKLVKQPIQKLLQGVRVSHELDEAVWGFCYSTRHISGVLLLLQAWMTDTPVVDLRALGKEDLAVDLSSHKVTHISAPATFYRLACPLPAPIKSVVKVSNGGEPLDANIVERVEASFPNAEIRNVYASTEFGSLLVAKGHAFTIPDRLANVVKIEQETIWVHRDRVASSVVFEGDWYDTADQVEWIDGTSFTIIGRASEHVKVLGHLVSLRKVEAVINGVEEVKISRVQATPHAVFGTLLSAEVVVDEGASLTRRDIKTALSELLRDYEVPSRIKIVDHIETTYTGKLARVRSDAVDDHGSRI